MCLIKIISITMRTEDPVTTKVVDLVHGAALSHEDKDWQGNLRKLVSWFIK